MALEGDVFAVNTSKPARKTCRVGYPVHLSTLMWCSLTMGLVLLIAAGHLEFTVASTLERTPTSRFSSEQVAILKSKIEARYRWPIFVPYLVLSPFLLAYVIAFCEFVNQGTELRKSSSRKKQELRTHDA